jgi:hypothetical protein
MSFILTQYQFDLERELTHHTRAALTTVKPEVERQVRSVLRIQHDTKDRRPIHDRNIVYCVMRFLSKNELAIVSCVNRLWHASSDCPYLWRRIFYLDTSIGLDKQLFSNDPQAIFLAKAYYMSQHTKMRAAICQVATRQNIDQFTYARKLFLINLFLPK